MIETKLKDIPLTQELEIKVIATQEAMYRSIECAWCDGHYPIEITKYTRLQTIVNKIKRRFLAIWGACRGYQDHNYD